MSHMRTAHLCTEGLLSLVPGVQSSLLPAFRHLLFPTRCFQVPCVPGITSWAGAADRSHVYFVSQNLPQNELKGAKHEEVSWALLPSAC